MTSFSSEDDAAMWKYAIENQKTTDKYALWEAFRAETRSKRTTDELYLRFSEMLLPHLSETSFHTGTKLEPSQEHMIPMEKDHLQEPSDETEIELVEDGIITEHTVEPIRSQKKEMKLNTQTNSSASRTRKMFSPEDDELVWKYLIENLEDYTPGPNFWKTVAGELDRHPVTLKVRFTMYLAPNLHNTDFDLETKMKIYKKCRIPVDEEYLKTLKKQVDLRMNKDGSISWYRKTWKKSKKRKALRALEDKIRSAKRADRSQYESEDDLIFDHEVSGRGFPNPEMILGPVKRENRDDHLYDREVDYEAVDGYQIAYENQEEVPFQWHNHQDSTIQDLNSEVMEQMSERIMEKMQGMETSIVAEMSKKIDALAENTAITSASIQAQVDSIGAQIGTQARPSEPHKVSTMSTYLSVLKDFASQFESPELKEMQKRIDAALQNPSEDDTVPIHSIRTMLDVGLAMIHR